MKAHIATTIVSITVAQLTTGCNLIGNKMRDVETSSFVCQYARYNKSNFCVDDNCTDSILYLYPKFINGEGAFRYTFLDKGKEQEENYNKLCKKHNDYGYKHKVTVIDESIIMSNIYVDFDPVRIEIISDCDFDEAHPAGSSLSDIFYFRSFTPYPFIKREYTGEKYTLINKRLDQLTAEELILSLHFEKVFDSTYEMRQLLGDNLRPQIILQHQNFPIDKQEHNLTITLTDSNGNGYTYTSAVIFKEVSSENNRI